MKDTIDDTTMRDELEKILRSEFYVNEHDNCDDSCSKKWHSDQAYKRAVASIINLVDKEVIGEDDKLEHNLYDKGYEHFRFQKSVRHRNKLRAEQRAKLKGVSNE